MTDAPSKQKAKQPGKAYGIISLICGLEPYLLKLLSRTLNYFHIYDNDVHNLWAIIYDPWSVLRQGLWFIFPTCVFFGIIFGIAGRNTHGKVYAIVGLSLILLFLLYLQFWHPFFSGLLLVFGYSS